MNIKEEFKNIIDDCCLRGIFPGANLCVIRGEDEFFISSGYKSIIPQEEKNQIDTIYDIASLTKVVVTTTLIMQLIDKKYISLDTRVFEILPEFKEKDITILDLLTHTSGLPADIKLDLNVNKEIITKKIFECEKSYEKNTKVIYSDLGFIILGLIIERILKIDLDKAAIKNIFNPLGMKDTGYCPKSEIVKRIAPTEISPHFNKLLRGQAHDRKAYLMNGVSGHAGVFSTINDLSKFARMILHNGELDGNKILGEESVDKLFLKATPDGQINRGLGYLVYDERGDFSKYNSIKTIYHTGFTGTSMLIDKEKELVIILLSNRVHPTRSNIRIIEERRKIHERIMELCCC